MAMNLGVFGIHGRPSAQRVDCLLWTDCTCLDAPAIKAGYDPDDAFFAV
jgi:hypothetical protein